jgi:hypothetical protein
MKAKQSAKLFLMMAFLAITVVSCSKTELGTNYGNLPVPATQPDATLMDFGPLNDTTRHMQAVLSNQDYLITNSDGDLSGSGAQINLTFFSGIDGGIKDGVYNYSTAADKKPFTFGNALFTATDNFYTGTPLLLDLSDGTVTVTKTGSTYDLLFKFNLTNGDTFSSSFNGQMSYSDQY